MPKIKRQPNGTYVKRFRYKDELGEWKCGYVTGHTKAECEDKYIRKSMALRTGGDETTITVQQLYETYITASKTRLKASSIESMSYALRLHVLPYFGEKKIKNVTLRDVEIWKARMDDLGFKYKYKAKIYVLFSAMFNYACRNQYLSRNVVALAGGFSNKEIKESEPIWTLDDFKRAYAVMDNIMWRSYFAFLFFTGVRKNEATCLTWHDLSPNFDYVVINKTLTHKGCADGISYEITRPKTNRSNRQVLIPDCLCAILREYRAYCETIDGFSDDSFVWGVDKPLAENTIKRKLDEYAKLANVPRIQVKGLRHSHDSYLHELGVDDFEIAAISGRTVRVTTDVYIHTYDARKQAIRDKINTDL